MFYLEKLFIKTTIFNVDGGGYKAERFRNSGINVRKEHKKKRILQIL
jgi:hypothetical protein